jgi:DNA-binding MarR family transcriptional regulator
MDYHLMLDYSGMTIDEVLDGYGRLMRALHVARATRGVPWTECSSLTLPQLRVLSLLAAREQGISGRELAVLLDVGPSAITPLVDRLVGQGLARRQEDPDDRRVTRLFATNAGLTLLERMVAGQRELMREVLARLSPDELEVVGRAFGLLQTGIQQVAPPAETSVGAAR